MSPSAGGWGFNLLYSFSGEGAPWGPLEKLMMDGAGNLYGTTYIDGAYGQGAVFELTPTPTGWTYTSLHDFTGGADGAYPYSGLVFDSEGNLYGTAANGGTGTRLRPKRLRRGLPNHTTLTRAVSVTPKLHAHSS